MATNKSSPHLQIRHDLSCLLHADWKWLHPIVITFNTLCLVELCIQWCGALRWTRRWYLKQFIIPPEQKTAEQWSCWGRYWFHSVCPSVRLSRLPCPLCNIYSSGWILSILATNDHYHERVCRTQWPLTLTYIFKVIWPWHRKSCPLSSVYSSGWILFIFGTNDHYH